MDKIYQLYCNLYEEYGSKFFNPILKDLGFDDQVKELIPWDVILETSYLYIDNGVITNKNRVMDLEFLNYEFKEFISHRYAINAIVLKELYGLEVVTVIISTVAEENYVEFYKMDSGELYPMYIYSLKSIYGNTVMDEIREKNENNEKLTESDIVRFSLAPIYNDSVPVEKLYSNFADLAFKLDDKNFDFLRYCLIELSRKFYDNDDYVRDIIKKIISKDVESFKKFTLDHCPEFFE